MRKLIYHVAMSVDGFIARKDGSTHGFSAEGEHVTDYLAAVQTYDRVLMGRATYEAGYQYGVQPGQPSPIYPGMHYIFSKTLRFETEPHERVRVIDGDEVAFVQQLKEAPGTDIYLSGGGAFAGFLLVQKLIDTVIIKQNPLVLGRGIGLFGDSPTEASLTLAESKTYGSGVVLLTYDVTY